MLIMADNNEKSEKKQKATYKFGQKELDLNKYIHNLGTNLQAYMDKQTHWSDGQRQEFVNAYNTYIQGLTDQRDNNTNRFYTDDAGQIYDTTNVLSSKDDDGIDPNGSEYYYDDKGNQITTDDYNALRKRKQKNYNTFSANREVASYFNWIGKHIDPISKEDSKQEKFDISKHGFVNYWNKKNNKTGEKIDLKPYLDMDAYDKETGKRARTNRLAYLSGELSSYLNSLEDNYNWDGASYKSMDEYKQSLQNLLNHMSDGTWDNNDIIAANQAGIGGSFYNAFFTEDEIPNLSDEDREKLAEQREQEARDKEWQSEVKRRYDIYNQNKGQWHSGNRYTTQLNDYTDEEGNFNYTKWADSFDSSHPYYREIKQDKNYKNYLNKFFEQPFVEEANRIIPFLIANQNTSRQLSDGRYYLTNDIAKDKETNSALIFNPQTGTLERAFIGEVKDLWDELKTDYGNNRGWSNPYEKYYKLGGVLEKFQFGGGFDVNKFIGDQLNSELKNRATVAGKEVDEQQADERRVGLPANRAKDTAINDSDFTAVEYARIGGAIADITSLISAFIPGYGTAVSAGAGLTSTLMNAGADFADDGVSGWQATKNMLTNLGMDIVGLIPGGGAAAKGTKITRSILKTLPKVALAVSASQAFNNREEILASLDKATSNPKDMNVGDWQNLAQALSLVAGGSQVAGAAINKRRLQNKNKVKFGTDTKVVVDIADSAGNKRSVLFDGDDAKAIRAAREKGGKEGTNAINDILKKYENTQGWTVQQEVKNGLRKGDKWWKPKWGDTEKGAIGVYDLKADDQGAYLDRGRFKADEYTDTMTRLTKDDTISAITEQKTKAQNDIIEQLRPDLNDFAAQRDQAQLDLDELRKRVESQKNAIGTDTYDNARARIAEIEARQATPEYATRKANLSTLEGNVQRNQTELDRINSRIGSMSVPVEPTKPKGIRQPVKPIEPIKPKDYDTNARAKAKYDVAKSEYDAKVSKYEAAYKAYEVRKAQQDADWPAYEKALSDYKKAKKKYDKEIKRLNTQRDKLTTQIATDSATIKSENDWLGDTEKSTLEGRLSELQSRDKALKKIERSLQRKQKAFDNFTNARPQSYQDWINAHSDLDGNILWDLPNGRKSEAITKEAFEEILKNAGIKFTKQGGTLNLNSVRKFYNGASITGLPRATKNNNVEEEPIVMQDRFGKMSVNPTISYGLPRAIYADIVNRKVTDMAKAAEKPYVLNPVNLPTRTITGDLNAEMQGQQNAAAINRMASKPLTSSGEQQMATQLEAAVKGQEFINQGKAQSDNVRNQKEEQNFQEARQLALTNQERADKNTLSQMQTDSNKSKYEMAYESNKHKSFDTLWQQLEYDARQKEIENKAYSQHFAKEDIDNVLTYDLENQAKAAGISLDDATIAVWNKVVSGQTTPSSLTGADEQNYLKARNIYEQLYNKMLKSYMGIPDTPWSNVRMFNAPKTEEFTPVITNPRSMKNGAKIEIAKIKARSKDADRFQKQIKEYHDRHQKMLEKLADSIYGFIKTSQD